MILSIILGFLTITVVIIHGIIVWAGYHLVPQFATPRKSDLFALGFIAVSGLLHITYFIR